MEMTGTGLTSLIRLFLLMSSYLMMTEVTSIAGKVTRCFEDTDCVPNDVCINHSCYEIRMFEEQCSFDKECSHLNRRLLCLKGQCACQANLKWIWSISKCGPMNYCQIEQDCPGSDFKCNHTLTRCYKINPIKSRTKKLPRASRYSSSNEPSVLSPVLLLFTFAALAFSPFGR